jgi:peptidoglycan/xylan/chitin deacetylase (PgdA/CDA1 family)
VIARALCLAVLAVPVAIPPGLRGKELERLQTRQRVVALTFDGGGNSVGAWRLVATLERKRVPATFFLTGHFVRTYPRLARVIGRRFAVGNHTVDHSDLTRLSTAQVRREIALAGREIEAATGRDPRPLFRFPYGARDARTIRIANDLGYASIRWSVDTLGWMGVSSPGGIVHRVVTHLQPGAIVLLHVGAAKNGATLDTKALPALVDAVRRRGYRFVTLESVGRP